jgi:TolB-like protein/DNA-binding winged helix-turn-helix (wHTH) protein/Flp pilus assembly protein TadD
MADAQRARVFRFGPFEADLANRELFKEGVPVSLTGQPFEVLALLLEHSGQLVTRDQLRTRLWPTGTVVEFEHSITVAITKLREALGDKSQDSRFIATVPRHGYRFIAPVSTPAPAALKPAPFAETSLLMHSPAAPQHERRRKWIVIAMLAVLIVGLAYVFVSRLWILRHPVAVQSAVSGTKELTARAASSTTAAPFNPPPHSIAVLPFVNISGDKEQEYFSDGLTEELLNSLVRIKELQVAARTSSFYFKGKDVDLSTIAHKLSVASVLEGSVRRSGHTIRITAQLNNAVTGYHLWSETYDRDLKDVLNLQTEIATAVARALKITLLDDLAARLEVGGTRNPAAFDAYLRGAKASSSSRDTKHLSAAIAAYTEAIRLDPHYALAFVGRSIAFSWAAGSAETPAEDFDKAQADAHQALALAPDLGQAHLALAFISLTTLNFAQANEAYERALALAPGNAEVLRLYSSFAVFMGHFDAGVAAARRAVLLDPLARESHYLLGRGLYFARRYEEAVSAFGEVISLDSDFKLTYAYRGLAYYWLGDLQRARASCETKPDFWSTQQCLSVIYDKLGRHADSEAQLEKFQAAQGDSGAYQYATIYAQRGNLPKALEWLDTAMRLRDPGLQFLKSDQLLDPLRKEPRFQAIERELNFSQ